MPGHTAYPWVFPNDDPVARIGLTMPIDLDLEAVDDREAYGLLRPDAFVVRADRKSVV